MGYVHKEMERYLKEIFKITKADNLKGTNTYVERVVKSCGRSPKHFLQTRPKIIIS